MKNLNHSSFSRKLDGEDVNLFTLAHPSGLKAYISNYGSTLVGMEVPDGRGGCYDPVLGYPSLDGYISGNSYFGATLGRCSNRIANAAFEIDGTEYRLTANAGIHHLHGGNNGFHGKVWRVLGHDANRLRLAIDSPDGEEGYPGNCHVEATWELTDECGIRFTFSAVSDRPTVCHPGQHTYFNLGDKENILNHTLETPAARCQSTFIDGNWIDVEGTPLDFRRPKVIGDAVVHGLPFFFCGGCDRYFGVSEQPVDSPRLVAIMTDPQTSRCVELWTTEPGFLFYSGMYLKGDELGRGERAYGPSAGACLEPEVPPNSINLEGRDLVLLRPGEVRRQINEYRFASNWK